MDRQKTSQSHSSIYISVVLLVSYLSYNLDIFFSTIDGSHHQESKLSVIAGEGGFKRVAEGVHSL